METSKKKQDASDIVQDNNKTLRDFYVLVSTDNRVYSRFTKYNISHYSPFKFAKKIGMIFVLKKMYVTNNRHTYLVNDFSCQKLIFPCVVIAFGRNF